MVASITYGLVELVMAGVCDVTPVALLFLYSFSIHSTLEPCIVAEPSVKENSY